MASPLTTTLKPGATGPGVLTLQKFLNDKGFLVSRSGPGSPGQETDFFGPATEAALLHYQKAVGLPSHGSVDEHTMTHVNSGGDGQGGPGYADGQGGPTTTPTPTGQAGYTVTDPTSMVQSQSPYFLIQIAGEGSTPNSIFLVDNQDKQIYPFADQTALQNMFPGSSMDQIMSTVTSVPAAMLNSGGGLSGYQFNMGNAQSTIQDDGTIPAATPSDAALASTYGQQPNDQAVEQATNVLDGFSNLLESGAAGTSLGSGIVQNIMQNPSLVASYISAMAYGGYTLQDVYMDMLKWQSLNGGQGAAIQANPISPTIPASTYKASSAYQAVKSTPQLNVSPTIAGLDSSVLTLPVLQMPTSALQQIDPLSNPDSPQFQQAMEQYKSAAYESSLAMATADNDVSHTQAQSQWNQFKSEIQDRLGITLSDNAVQAWNQLNAFQQQAGQNNLGGSGLVQQQVDAYLKQQMGVNQSMRNYYTTYEDQAQESYYQNYASPQEVKDLIAQDQASGLPQDQWKSVQWGLLPNSNVQSYLTLSNLQAQFPTASTAELQGIINQYIDPNGNFYSQLYGKYAANADPYSNSGGTAAQYGEWQAGQVEDASTNAANTADNALPGQTQNEFVQPTGNNGPNPVGQDSSAYGTTPFNSQGAASAAADLTGNPFGTANSTPATSNPPVSTSPFSTTSSSQTSTPTSSSNTNSSGTTPIAPVSTATNPISTIAPKSNSASNLSIGPNTAYPNLSGSANASALSGVTLGNTAPANPAPQNNPYITAAQQESSVPNGLTSGSGFNLGSALSSAGSAIGNFFRGL